MLLNESRGASGRTVVHGDGQHVVAVDDGSHGNELDAVVLLHQLQRL